MSPTFKALANHNYRLYATGGLVSNVGTWMQRVAQDWLILQLTAGSGIALGITTGLQFLPMLLISPYAGVVADRMSKRRLLQITQLSMASTSLVLGILAVTGVAQPWHVYVLALIFGIGAAFDAPARQSFVPEMVSRDDLSNAVGLNSASFNLGRIVGPAVAGLLIAALGSGARATGWVFLINAASYGAVIYALRRMDERELTSPEAPANRSRMIRAGVGYVRRRPDVMLVMTVVFFTATFGLNFQLTSALMATEVFGKGAGEYGILGSTMAIGSLAGALLAARRSQVDSRWVVGAALAFGVAEIISGIMPSYWSFTLWTPVLGLCALTMMTAANTTVQLAVAPEFRGRVMALYLMVFMGGTPAGAPIIGWVGESFGARWTLLFGGLLTILGTLAAVAVFGRRSVVGVTEPAPVTG